MIQKQQPAIATPPPMPAATMSGRNGRSYTYLKILFLLFILNSLSLYFYFRPSSTPSPPDLSNRLHDPRDLLLHSPPGASGESSSGSVTSSLMKHWPILPSYLPWTNPGLSPSFRSCEAFFGNGFIKDLPVISASSVAIRGGGGGGGGWFRCFFSQTLQSSVCEGGSVRMNAKKIKMAKGGERLIEVKGRTEEEEIPVFEDGAFQVEGGDGRKEGERLVDQVFVDNYIGRNKLGELIGSARIVGKGQLQCDQWIEEPTLMVIRFEYANLFHTMTDWYNGYVSSRVTGLPYRPKVVFVDGHCKSPMEETWRAFFSGFTYAKHFHGSVCFRHIIFSPLGYDSAMFKGLSNHIDCSGTSSRSLWVNPDDRKTARLSEFGEMMRAAFNFPLDKSLDRGVSRHNVLFVRREDYLAHPRHSGKPESRLSNEPEVFEALKTWTSSHSGCKVNLVNGLFAHMSMKDQVQAIQDASVIIGAHGAGLTHIVSATPDTVILEIISSQYRRPHFQLIAKWKGLGYRAINLSGSYATPSVVVDQLKNILKGLGC